MPTTTPAKKTTTPAKKAVAPKVTAADYGYAAAFLAAHPDVKRKVDLAVKQKWTAARLEAEIKTTKWWISRTDSQRQWDLLSKENPAEANRQVGEKAAQVTQALSRLGITGLDRAQIVALSKSFVMNGSSDAEIQSALAGKFTLTETLTGQAATTVDSLREQANEFGITLSHGDLQKYTQQIIGGQMDAQGFTDVMREQAKILYAPIASALDRGVTVKQYLAPYLGVASKELGVDPNTIDATDPKWTKFLNSQSTPGTPMTVDEALKTIRTDGAYGWNQTTNAKQIAAQAINDFGQMWGSIG